MDGQRTCEVLMELRHVTKRYEMGTETVTALEDVSLKIRSGEILCLLGASGSGKSTFLNLAGGLEKPTKGEIRVGNILLHRLDEQALALFRQKNVGFIFQSYQLLPMLTAVENVALPLVFRGQGTRKREQLARRALEEVGLSGLENRRPSQMSGGQQQRVGIARALAGSPRLLFADEPTGNLDSRTTREIMGLMEKTVRRGGQTLIIVTHDPFVAGFADRTVVIGDGRIISDKRKGETDEA